MHIPPKRVSSAAGAIGLKSRNKSSMSNLKQKTNMTPNFGKSAKILKKKGSE